MPKPPQGAGRTRFVLVDSMRGLAALGVLVYHVSFTFGTPRSAVWQLVSERSSGVPMTAVVVFFLISGFVLYRPYVAARFDGAPMPSLRRYAVRRIARIVPAYWVALLIVAIWFGMHYVFTAHGLLTYFGFLQLYGRPSTLNGGITPAWTLCVEVTFYAALPLIALLARRLGRGRRALRSELLLCLVLMLISLAWQCAVFVTTSHTATESSGC